MSDVPGFSLPRPPSEGAPATAKAAMDGLQGFANTVGEVLLIVMPAVTAVVIIVLVGKVAVSSRKQGQHLDLMLALQVVIGASSLAASLTFLGAFVLTSPPAIHLIDKGMLLVVGVIGFLATFVFAWRETIPRCFPKVAPVPVPSSTPITHLPQQAPPLPSSSPSMPV